jgi:hypothetical protein
MLACVLAAIIHYCKPEHGWGNVVVQEKQSGPELELGTAVTTT